MRLTLMGLLCLNGLLTSMSAAAAVSETTTDAIWRVQQIDLRLRTGHRHYSCSSLQTKISSILGAVGAKRVVVDLSCGARFSNNVLARIATEMPIPATPANIEAATTHDARAELVARVRQSTLPSANDIDVFPVEWRTVSIPSVRGLHVGPGDCELLEGLTEQVFPHLELRVVQKRLHCNLNARPILVVEALMRREA